MLLFVLNVDLQRTGVKYCANCGKEVVPGANVCTNCGFAIDNTPNINPETQKSK